MLRRRHHPGDFESAFDSLFLRAAAVARRIIADPAEADDAAGEALAHAYARWERVGSLPRPDGWVLRAVVNIALEAVKRGAAPASDVVAALARLPRAEREAVGMKFLTELTDADVAHVLGASEDDLRARLEKGIAAMRGDVAPAPGTTGHDRKGRHVAAPA